MNTQSRVTKPKSLKPKGPSPEVDLGFRWGAVNTVLLGLGSVALVAGYLSLARGSITLAPVLQNLCAVDGRPVAAAGVDQIVFTFA